MNIIVTTKGIVTYHGDSFQFSAIATDADTGAVVDLTGAVSSFTAKRSLADPDSAAVMKYLSTDSSPGPYVTVPTPTNGKILVKVPPLGTAGLPVGQTTTLYFDIHTTLTDGSRWTVCTGSITVQPAILG